MAGNRGGKGSFFLKSKDHTGAGGGGPRKDKGPSNYGGIFKDNGQTSSKGGFFKNGRDQTSNGGPQKDKGGFFKNKIDQTSNRGPQKDKGDFFKNEINQTSNGGSQKNKDGFFKRKTGRDQLHNVDKGRIEKSHKDAKPFDKKTYRMKKYSNKYKLDKWEDQRRKEVLKKYYKDLKKDPMAGKYTPFDFDKAGEIGSHSEGEEINDETPQPETSGGKRIYYVLHPDRLEKAKQKSEGAKPKLEDRLDKHGQVQPFWKVKQEMHRLKEEKLAKKQELTKAAEEREQAIAKYKQKKADKFKKLSKRTKTGQPFMKDRMQMLLESIQKSS